MNKTEYKQLILQNMDYIVTDLQASVQLVVGCSNFTSQVSELVCLTTEMFGANGLTIAKGSSKYKEKKKYIICPCSRRKRRIGGVAV